MRDAACVHDGDIGASVVRGLDVSVAEQALAHLVRVGMRDLAAEKANGKGRHRPGMLLGLPRVEVGGPALTRDAAYVAERRQLFRVGGQVARAHEAFAAQTRRERFECRPRDVGDRDTHCGKLLGQDVGTARFDLDTVRLGVGDRRRDRVVVRVECENGLEAELRSDDPEHARAAAEVEEAPGLELEQKLDAELRRRVRTGPELTTRVDDDRGRVRGRLAPGRADPERSQANRTVELLPPVAPVRDEVLPAHAAEHLPEPLLTAGVGVGDELDAIREIDLLEAVGEEREHAGPRFFCALGGDGDRDAAADVQRKALFSLSKKPSLGSYVASVESRSNSSSRRRCSSVRCRGTTTFTSTRWFPRPNPCRTGNPRPRRTRISPGCVPGSKVSSTSPSRVGTLTVAPRAACVTMRSTVVYTSLPSRTNRSLGRTRTST